MPFTITKMETGIKCPVNPIHKGGVYSLIINKSGREFYLCAACETWFIYNKNFGYVPLKPNPSARKVNTVTEDGVKKVIESTIKETRKKTRKFSRGRNQVVCSGCGHRLHKGKACIIYKYVTGKLRRTNCDCEVR